ncbi:hypothetical protein SAMN05445060_2774 [Williamsia sterculiae]|uniref:Uncharacterized protein n=1 Tax=Williamsia sterculiae TaxID=1344003 RepID=A0A1N7GH51_9NOCA|nr:hypothetical protein SAMN05445060_2774 [Williamsia sterculiae]
MDRAMLSQQTSPAPSCPHAWETITELIKPERRTPGERKRTADMSKVPYAQFTIRRCTKCGLRRPIDYQISK